MSINEKKKISQFQHTIIIGSLLGDIHIQKTNALTEKCRLRFSHSIKQKNYVDWKYTVFKNQFCSKTKPPYKTARILKDCFQGEYIFYTEYANEFSWYHSTWYTQKIKVDENGKLKYTYKKKIPNNILELLVDPVMLAIWYLDDGSKRNDCNACRLATQSFSEKENIMLQQCLQTNFNLSVTINKYKNKKTGKFLYGLSIPSKNSSYKNFKNYIYNFVKAEIPSMLYKLQ